LCEPLRNEPGMTRIFGTSMIQATADRLRRTDNDSLFIGRTTSIINRQCFR